jgi:hypothetical protein
LRCILAPEGGKAEGKEWPSEPDNPDKKQIAHHKEPLANGGHDGYPNIEPKPKREHTEHHKKNGDFKEWRKRRGTNQ